MRSERVDSQTVLAGIVQMVAKARRSKSPMLRMTGHVWRSPDGWIPNFWSTQALSGNVTQSNRLRPLVRAKGFARLPPAGPLPICGQTLYGSAQRSTIIPDMVQYCYAPHH
jgi:hypothetical protein